MKIILSRKSLLKMVDQVAHQFGYANKIGEFTNGRNGKKYSAYSGDCDHYNDENSMKLKFKGPLPIGKWEVTKIESHKGPFTARLQPCPGTEVYGRDGFLIHGDNAKMNLTASQGCIVVEKDCREHIQQGDLLEVFILGK